jgi:hypothetical protein
MRGKLITNDPAEIAAIEHKERLYDAIALIQQFTEGFSTVTPDDLRQGGISALKQHASETADVLKLTPVELFTRQYDKAKKKNPAVSQIAVAEKEEARTSIMIERLEALPGMKHYYKDHPIYMMITGKEAGYLKYLNDILGQKQPEGSTGAPTKQLFTFEGKHTPEQRNNYRQWLIGKMVIENISREDFEYLFSVKEIYEGMPTMIFLKPPGHAKRLLMILIDDFKSMRESKIIRANQCITIKSGVVIDSNTHAADPRIFKHMLK